MVLVALFVGTVIHKLEWVMKIDFYAFRFSKSQTDTRDLVAMKKLHLPGFCDVGVGFKDDDWGLLIN